jgi:hypothetical protein
MKSSVSVPGYEVSRMNLLAGNDEHTQLTGTGALDGGMIVPANDKLFTSGTLGRYSNTPACSDGKPATPTGRIRSRGRLNPN